MKWTFAAIVGAGILLIWLIAGAGMKISKGQQPTVEKVAAHVEQPLPPVTMVEARAEYIDRLARQVNGLDFENRRQLGMRRVLDDTFSAMTIDERNRFLDETLPQGFEQIIERFNRMEPVERQAAVERAMADLQALESGAGTDDIRRTRERLEDGTLKRVIGEGFEAYLQNASAETKLDLAPLIEQIQRNMQGLTRS
jgi:hypothetical protein